LFTKVIAAVHDLLQDYRQSSEKIKELACCCRCLGESKSSSQLCAVPINELEKLFGSGEVTIRCPTTSQSVKFGPMAPDVCLPTIRIFTPTDIDVSNVPIGEDDRHCQWRKATTNGEQVGVKEDRVREGQFTVFFFFCGQI